MKIRSHCLRGWITKDRRGSVMPHGHHGQNMCCFPISGVKQLKNIGIQVGCNGFNRENWDLAVYTHFAFFWG